MNDFDRRSAMWFIYTMKYTLCMKKSRISTTKSSRVILADNLKADMQRLETLRLERESLGIEFDCIASFIDMVAEEDVNEALEIIGKLARLQK